MHASLTSKTLRELRGKRPYPAVSLAMPTHRRQPEAAQDPIRLGNLVGEAVRRLEKDRKVSREHRDDVVAQLHTAVRETDLAHAREGLLVFAALGEHQVWAVGRSVPERVVIADTFLTRNLVASDAADHPYWVLTVAADRITLFSGQGAQLTEETGHGFPLGRDLADPDAERKERVGDLPSTFRDERTRRFFGEAGTALSALLRTDRRPLYLTGESAALTLIAEVSADAADAVHVPHGGLARSTPAVVADAIADARAAQADRAVADALGHLDGARSRGAYAAGLDEVWQQASAGRVGLLVVEEHYRATVRVSDGHLQPAGDDAPDAVHDIVDGIVEAALDTGADVAFVPDGTLSESGHMAAGLRF